MPPHSPSGRLRLTINLTAMTSTAIRLMATNNTTAHSFQEALPKNHKMIRATAQNQESPEWANRMAILRNAPGFSATRIRLESRASSSSREVMFIACFSKGRQFAASQRFALRGFEFYGKQEINQTGL